MTEICSYDCAYRISTHYIVGLRLCSSSNFISRRIQQSTFYMHDIYKIIHKCIPLVVAREAEAHRADNRYFNNDTAGGKQGARGNILLFPDVSSTLH